MRIMMASLDNCDKGHDKDLSLKGTRKEMVTITWKDEVIYGEDFLDRKHWFSTEEWMSLHCTYRKRTERKKKALHNFVAYFWSLGGTMHYPNSIWKPERREIVSVPIPGRLPAHKAGSRGVEVEGHSEDTQQCGKK
jgi:hypothetical protein